VAPRPRPRRVERKRARVRWDRVGRVGLLVVFAIVVALYAEHTVTYFSTRSQADTQLSIVHRLTKENVALAKQERALNDPATIERDARVLGMVRPGERPYVITNFRH
jgi:cell division protein FtsB